jgi:thiol:disulfide interchange protein
MCGLGLLLLLSAVWLNAEASVSIKVSPETIKPGEMGYIKATLTMPEDMHQTYIVGENDFFYLTATSGELVFSKTQYPEPDNKLEGNEWIYRDKVTLTLPFIMKADAKTSNIKIKAEMSYNICYDTGFCLAPEVVSKDLVLNISNAVAVKDTAQTDISASAAVMPAAQTESKTQTSEQADKPAKGNIWTYLLMAFLGGIILNIMPCVLPVLSIKAMSIVKQAHEDKSVIMKHSFAYTAGILTSFAVLALVIVGLKLAGEAVGWGFQFQNTTFVLVLTSMIFVFALMLFDVFIITPPGMSSASKASAQSGFHGSFFGGIFAVLLATPCSAPMLGTALGFAFSQPPVLIIVFFILIGLGLALPFILLGLNPKLMKVIPKPGEWMNIFKEVMAFLLIGTAVWLLHVIYQQNGGEYLLNVLIYLVFLAFATWLYGRFVRMEHSNLTQWIFTILAIVIVASSAVVFLAYTETAIQPPSNTITSEKGFEGWQIFSTALVDDLIDKGQPVFIDFGAKWCMTCLSNEKTVTTTEEMKQAFKAKKVQLVRGDFTKKNPEMQAFMKKYGKAGVPFYVLFVPYKETIVFPEIITIPMVKKALETIPD